MLGTDVNSGLSMREIAAEEVAAVVANAPEAYDTLKEIADWIADHPSDLTSINSRLTAVESGLSTAQSDISSLQSDVADLNTAILAVQDDIEALQQADIVLQTQITNIESRLIWQELEDPEEEGQENG